MTSKSELQPRWLDIAAASAYVSLTESAFRRRVALGRFPKPNLSAGIQSPRWDRLELDAAFGCKLRNDKDSTDVDRAVKGLVDDIIKQGPARSRRRKH